MTKQYVSRYIKFGFGSLFSTLRCSGNAIFGTRVQSQNQIKSNLNYRIAHPIAGTKLVRTGSDKRHGSWTGVNWTNLKPPGRGTRGESRNLDSREIRILGTFKGAPPGMKLDKGCGRRRRTVTTATVTTNWEKLSCRKIFFQGNIFRKVLFAKISQISIQ